MGDLEVCTGDGSGRSPESFLREYGEIDIHMMCWGSGQERTKEEYASLVEASGWRFVTCHYPSLANMSVVEGVAL